MDYSQIIILSSNTYIASHHSAAEHRPSTRILHLTLFSASVLISAQVFLNPLASSRTVLRHVFLGLPLPRLPWGFHSRVRLAMSLDGLCSVRPNHPHLRFLICKSILGYFVRFHSSIFIIWSSQEISVPIHMKQKAHKINDFKCHTQLSEPYRVVAATFS